MESKISKITGLYLRTRVRDLKSGSTVFEVAVGPSQKVRCIGQIIPPRCSVKVEVQGTWKIDAKYGKQLINCVIKEVVTDTTAVMDYLLAIPGVGEYTAVRVRDTIGTDVLNVTKEKDPEGYLVSACDIQPAKAALIVEYIRTNQVRSELFSILSHHGGSFVAAEKIYQQYGAQSLVALWGDPYSVGMDAGLSFQVCDAIAIGAGRSILSQQRIQAALYTVMERESTRGHTYLPTEEAVKKAQGLLGDTLKDPTIGTVLIASCLHHESNRIRIEDDRVYLRPIYWQEKKAATALARLIRTGIRTECDPDELCAYAEAVCGVTYAERQREIFKAIQHGGVCVLTGGPGTGKTTVIKGFLTAYEKVFPNNTIRLCAPTGRASQRMAEATGRPATTIHRLIEYRPYGDTQICKNEADPIKADCIVVDECSMVSIDTAELLFSAIRSGAMLLLVGDINQLPSVGPGNVLADIIASKVVPVVALNKTQRQGADSPIIINANRICNGDPELVEHKDFVFCHKDDNQIPEAVVELYKHYHDPDNPFKVQVLTPSRRRLKTGSEALSRAIQYAVNPNQPSIWYGKTGYAVGDKVMTIRNNYEVGYFNGDVGVITHIDQDCIDIRLGEEVLKFPTSCLDDLTLAYASTVHKAQGSEYETTIVALPSEPSNMLQRAILYTAVTRAKKRLYIVDADGSVVICVNTAKATKRNTTLKQRLIHSVKNM